MSHLQTLYADKQDKLMPKKKFTFITRKKEEDPLDHFKLHRKDEHNELFGPLLINNTSVQCGFSNKQGKELSLNVCTYSVCVQYIVYAYIYCNNVE